VKHFLFLSLLLAGCTSQSSVIIGKAEHARYTITHTDGQRVAFYHANHITLTPEAVSFVTLQGESVSLPCPCGNYAND